MRGRGAQVPVNQVMFGLVPNSETRCVTGSKCSAPNPNLLDSQSVIMGVATQNGEGTRTSSRFQMRHGLRRQASFPEFGETQEGAAESPSCILCKLDQSKPTTWFLLGKLQAWGGVGGSILPKGDPSSSPSETTDIENSENGSHIIWSMALAQQKTHFKFVPARVPQV